MKTIVTILLCFALVTPCSAPEPPKEELLAAIVLGIVVIAVGATAIYCIIKCAKRLNQPPPVIEGSTNRTHWTYRGEMQADGDNWVFKEPATNAVMFYRAKF